MGQQQHQQMMQQQLLQQQSFQVGGAQLPLSKQIGLSRNHSFGRVQDLKLSRANAAAAAGGFKQQAPLSSYEFCEPNPDGFKRVRRKTLNQTDLQRPIYSRRYSQHDKHQQFSQYEDSSPSRQQRFLQDMAMKNKMNRGKNVNFAMSDSGVSCPPSTTSVSDDSNS